MDKGEQSVSDSWERLGYYIQHELRKVAECQEEQAKEIAGVATSLRVLRAQLLLIAALASVLTSGVVSIAVGLILAYLKK